MSDFVIENGELVKYTGNGGDVVIPDGVTKIGGIEDYGMLRGAFKSCKTLTSVTIPDSVTYIGELAFEDCTNLKSVIIPNSVKRIVSYAFFGCTSLTSVTIPESVTNIDGSVFQACTNLASIEVSENNPNYTSMDGVLFNKEKTKLIEYPAGNPRTEYIIPDSVIDIGSFRNCKYLTSVIIPDGVTEIELATFAECASLASVTIPESVTEIGHNAFLWCKKLTDLYIKGYHIHGNFGEIQSITNHIRESILMLDTKDFSRKMDSRIKYPLILAYYRKTKDETALTYIKKQFSKIVIYAIQQNDIETIEALTAVDNLFTKKNIDKLIQTAIDSQRHEIYVMLLNYKAEKLGFKDITNQFRL